MEIAALTQKKKKKKKKKEEEEEEEEKKGKEESASRQEKVRASTSQSLLSSPSGVVAWEDGGMAAPFASMASFAGSSPCSAENIQAKASDKNCYAQPMQRQRVGLSLASVQDPSALMVESQKRDGYNS